MPYSKSAKGRPETGRFMKKVDATLYLGKAAGLYQQLIGSEAAILAQLRTGKTFLKGYLHTINASETAVCKCGLVEPIPHFLFSYRRWAQQRVKLRQHGEIRRPVVFAGMYVYTTHVFHHMALRDPS